MKNYNLPSVYTIFVGSTYFDCGFSRILTVFSISAVTIILFKIRCAKELARFQFACDDFIFPCNSIFAVWSLNCKMSEIYASLIPVDLFYGGHFNFI